MPGCRSWWTGRSRNSTAEQRLQAIRGQGYLDDLVYRRFDRYGNRALKLNRDCIAELERRRTCGLDACQPDGTIATPLPKPGDLEVEPIPTIGRGLHQLPEEELRANEPEAEKPRSIRNEPRAAVAGPSPSRSATSRPSRGAGRTRRRSRRPSVAGRGSQGPDREKAQLSGLNAAAKAARKRNRRRPERAGSIETGGPGVRCP
ncbi:MAG: hypothetical protein U0800_22685 [Isosphaeraceae bacterium]